MSRLLYFVPKNYLSYLLGRLAEIRLPKPLATWVIGIFATAFRVRLEEAAKPSSEYRSLAEFFTRDLKPSLRPIPPDAANLLLSPVDGKLRALGTIRGGMVEQVKGRTYKLAELLGNDPWAFRFEKGVYFNFYLSPSDYHHVHSPIGGQIMRSTYIPGALWPVGDWWLKRIDGLFCLNERLVTYLAGRFGLLALVMVGATNVGKLSVIYDDWRGNQVFSAGACKPQSRDYNPPKHIKAGERLGTFHLGSSVILFCEPGAVEVQVGRTPRAVRYGEKLAEGALA